MPRARPPSTLPARPKTPNPRPPAPSSAASNRSPVTRASLPLIHAHRTKTLLTAQRYFDQGLTLIYAFNHDEAARSFQRAADLDPNLAMAHWGIALALGPNYNIDVDEQREKQAYAEIQKAIDLSKANTTEPERAY